MPRKSKKKTTRKVKKSRTYRRKRYDGVMTIGTLQARVLDPFPQRKWAKMKYSDNLKITCPNTNLSYEYVYQLNGLFDPDFTAAGHQPYGFDTMAVLYNYYIVKSCYVEIEWYDPTTDGQMVGFKIQGDSISGMTISAVEEQPWTVLKTVSNTGSQRVVQRVKVNCPQALGLKSSQYMNDTGNYGATLSANPNIGVYLRLAGWSTQGATTSDVKFKITLIMDTLFYDRNTLTQS